MRRQFAVKREKEPYAEVQFARQTSLLREVCDLEGNFQREEFVTANDAIMMYSPFLAPPSDHSEYDK